MTISLNNALIGLSVLGGTSTYSSYQNGLGSSDSAAVAQARKAFTTPETTAPWLGAVGTETATSAQVAEIKRLASIIEGKTDSTLEDIPDVQTAFTTYKALENLRILTQAASSKTLSTTDRASLEQAFKKGIADLQTYLAGAPTKLLEIGFGSVTSATRSIGVTSHYAGDAVAGNGVTTTRAAPIEGLTGTEIFQLTLTRGTTTEVVNVDLSQSTQPPTLDSVAAAINAAIGSRIARDASGAPILDAEGKTTPEWSSTFTVKKTAGKWGLVFNPAGIEKVSIDQVAAGDALIVASGETATISGSRAATSANIYRIEDLTGSLSWERLNRINAVDTDATARAREAAASLAEKTDTKLAEYADYTVSAPTAANAIVSDASGYSYIVGTARGDMGAQLGDGADDLFVTKIDNQGSVVWQRTLGAAGSATGAAVTIAPNGEIVVAGTVSGAFTGSDDAETDLFVSRFNAKGEELSSTVVRRAGNDTASAVAVGNDGLIYVGGRNATGAGDSVIVRLDASGKLQERRIIDSGGSDSISALAIDENGSLLVLSNEQGTATLRRIGSGSLQQDLDRISLGSATAKAIAVSETGQIAIVGTTAAALNGPQANAISGASDAFATVLAPDFSSMLTAYIGTDNADQADSVTFLNGSLYVGGRTAGTLGAARSGMVDGFVARIDATDGTVQTVSQWGRASTAVEPVRLTAVTGGATSALGALGLHRGILNQQSSGNLVTETSLRAGDTFKISVDGKTARSITIDQSETMATLAAKIRRITGSDATISTPYTNGASSLKIVVKTGHELELIAGADGSDALGKLGLDPIRLVPPKAPDPKAVKVTPGGRFNLGLSGSLTLTDASTAATALSALKSAVSMIQSAYRSLYWDPLKANMVDGIVPSSGGSAYQQSRLQSYQAALSRLTS